MFLMAPWFVVLAVSALLAGVPLVIHLMNRQKTTPVEWGAMQFLLAANVTQKRRQQLDHWLLMAVRMLVLAVVVFLLARPLWLSSLYNPFATSMATDVAVVIDHSLSTGRRGTERTLFEQGLQTLDAITGLMRKSDSLAVVLAEHAPRALSKEPVVGEKEIAGIRDELRQVKPGLTDGPLADAVELARETINRGRNIRKMIFILSDEQKSGWGIENANAWRAALGNPLGGTDRNLSVYALSMGNTGTVSNVSVAGIAVSPAFLGLGRPAQVTAAVQNQGPGEMAAFPVELIQDGRTVATQMVGPLPSGQSVTVKFDATFTVAGSHWAKIQADAVDALEADNAAIAAVDVWSHLPVLIIDGELTANTGFPATEFLRAAMQPVDAGDTGAASGTLIQPKVVSVAEADGVNVAGYPVVIVNDVPRMPASVVTRLINHATSGHAVWVILGNRTDPGWAAGVSGTLLPVGAKGQVAPAKSVSVVVKDATSPMVALLTAAERNSFTGVGVNRFWNLSVAGSDTSTVLATSTGEPLVVDHAAGSNGGRIAVWGTSADGAMNNLPLVTNFVPLVNETLFHLAGSQFKGEGRQIEAGGTIVYTAPTDPALEGATLTRPDGSSTQVVPLLTNNRYLVTTGDTAMPGLYELRFAPASVPQPVYYSVAMDKSELDPAVLAGSDIDWLKTNEVIKEKINTGDLARVLGAENRGFDFWHYLALLVVGMLALEAFLAQRMARKQAGLKSAETILLGEAA